MPSCSCSKSCSTRSFCCCPRICRPLVGGCGIRRCVPHTPGTIFHARYLDSWTKVGGKKSRRRNHLAESFPKAYLVSVLAPSWLSSNRAWKTAPGGCDKHRGIRHIAHNTGSIFFVMLTTIMDEITVNVRVFILTLGRSFYFCPDWYVFIRATIH